MVMEDKKDHVRLSISNVIYCIEYCFFKSYIKMVAWYTGIWYIALMYIPQMIHPQ